MKRTRPIKSIPLGKFIAESWRVAIKPTGRPTRAPRHNSLRRLVRPGEQQSIVCGFCGNTIGVVFCDTSATANNRGGRR